MVNYLYPQGLDFVALGHIYKKNHAKKKLNINAYFAFLNLKNILMLNNIRI